MNLVMALQGLQDSLRKSRGHRHLIRQVGSWPAHPWPGQGGQCGYLSDRRSFVRDCRGYSAAAVPDRALALNPVTDAKNDPFASAS